MFTYRKFKSSGWFKPYTGNKTKNGRPQTTLNETGTGVYLIRKQNGKIIYVGKSANDVRRTLYRHFQTWTDMRSSYGRQRSPYERVTYKDLPGHFLCKVIFTETERQADILEQALIVKVKPKDNTLKLMIFTQSQVDGVIEKLEEAPF